MREQQIKDIVEQELERAKQLRHPRHWVIQYRGFEMSKAKTYFGYATRKGILRISCIFLGTREFTELKDTIRHELAHLMCGIEAKHNRNWQHAAHLLGCKPRASSKMLGELKETSKPKWRLMGTLEDGREIPFQASHVQLGKYLMPDRKISCKYGKIVSCRYVRNV